MRKAMNALLMAVLALTATVVVQPAAASADVGIQACYNGRIPGSSNWISTHLSVHVYGNACATRKTEFVYDNNASCCVPNWIRIERQEYGSYGWLTSNTRQRMILSQTFGTHYTDTVPWIQYTQQRFRACWTAGTTSAPNSGSWLCGPWVN
jgi:hypothetical protein